MSTPTTARGALLRRAGTLFAAAALVAGPVSSALAEPSGEPIGSPSATATVPVTTIVPDAAPAAPAAVAPALLAPSPETSAAAAFIASTLDEFGEHYVYPDADGEIAPGNYPDHGNTIDAMLALAAAGEQIGQAQQSLAWLESTIGSYVGTDWGDTYVGGTAKSLIGVVALGGDPTDVGGVDLVATLRGLETPNGRFSDTGSGDYSITITQALAVTALAKAGQPVTTASVRLLLDQQCADGGFRSTIGGSTCISDPDTTAFAAQALLAVDDALLCWTDVEGTHAAAAAGAEDALDHLADRQGADGGIENDSGSANANTTGVAGQAFVAGGRTAEATAAAGFVAGLQYDASAPAALQGAIAYSTADVTTGDAPRDSDVRATPQATLLLAGGSLASVFAPDVTAPAQVQSCPAEPTVTSTPTATTSTSTTPRPSTSTSSVTTTAPGSSDPTGSGDDTTTAGGSDGSASGPTGSLARTGSDLLLPVGLGIALVVVGGIVVAGTRRQGAHR